METSNPMAEEKALVKSGLVYQPGPKHFAVSVWLLLFFAVVVASDFSVGWWAWSSLRLGSEERAQQQ